MAPAVTATGVAAALRAGPTMKSVKSEWASEAVRASEKNLSVVSDSSELADAEPESRSEKESCLSHAASSAEPSMGA